MVFNNSIVFLIPSPSRMSGWPHTFVVINYTPESFLGKNFQVSKKFRCRNNILNQINKCVAIYLFVFSFGWSILFDLFHLRRFKALTEPFPIRIQAHRPLYMISIVRSHPYIIRIHTYHAHFFDISLYYTTPYI